MTPLAQIIPRVEEMPFNIHKDTIHAQRFNIVESNTPGHSCKQVRSLNEMSPAEVTL